MRTRAADRTWTVDRPLPTTRELAARFKLSAATAFRILQELTREDLFWQHTSGRFYRAAARPMLDRPKPAACLIRRLELYSALYRELLERISAGCGEVHRAMLLWHDDVLVNHAEPEHPPVFASDDAQRLLLNSFIERHGEGASGYLLDHLWSDAVLQRAGQRINPGVLLYRKAPARARLSNVRADFDSAATQALAHLLGRGFTHIVPVEPFSGDPAVSEFFAALENAASTLACRDRTAPMATAHTADEAAHLVQSLPQKTRPALLVQEDHTAVRFHSLLQAAGRACPQEVGLLSIMVTDIGAKAKITRLSFDFRAMERAAVSLLSATEPKNISFHRHCNLASQHNTDVRTRFRRRRLPARLRYFHRSRDAELVRSRVPPSRHTPSTNITLG